MMNNEKAEETMENSENLADPALHDQPNPDETTPYSAYQVKHLPTMFGNIHEKNVIFCVDTSGSMYTGLDAVKEHLIEALKQRAEVTEGSMFNLIEFNTDVTQWSDKMVQCTPQTVAVAMDWIRKLEAKTGTNTMDALTTAFSDLECEAVCLVTDGHPDQHPTDILDSIAYVADNRPVHCYYIESSSLDPSATDFLQDLAMETYGSFHVISITSHGSIEKITPMYRAEAAAERIVRTTDGNIYPSNHKVCTVTTTLNSEPHVVVEQPLGWFNYPPPLYPYHFYPYPYRHYYQYGYPDVGWSRYRPARATLQGPGYAYDDYVPGAGAALIGTTVLARRNANGYFYLGKVKSQILNNKFLVEFGPCKHGKYKDTTYQETYVHDIVSNTDALRHSVCTGDQVLAPWEPEGERFGPGIIIEGEERRTAQGGGPDRGLIVSFHNGRTADIPFDTAVWIPRELHDRITFELKLPKQVRCEFAEQDKTYPEDNLPGYPTSGARAFPPQYEVYEPGWIAGNDPVYVRGGVHRYVPMHVPMYPVYYKPQPKPSSITSEDLQQAIPGTQLTKSELNEKVMSQLMRYKMVLEDKNSTRDVGYDSKLLKRRETVPENTFGRSTEKSVTFKDPEHDFEPEFGDPEMHDSGRGSQTDIDVDLGYSDYEYELDDDFYRDEESQTTRDVAVGTDARLLYPRKKRRVQKKQPWKYWGQDPAPELLEPMHEGPYRVGPYEEAFTMNPCEDRRQFFKDGNGVKWSTSMSSYADYLAKHQPGSSVADAMHMPKPPDYKPEQQQPGRSVSETLHGNMSEADQLAKGRLDFRRKQALKREENTINQYEENERMKSLMLDQHRHKIMTQHDQENQRQQNEIDRVKRLREAKKEINEQLRARIEQNQEREQGRDQQRIDALRARRERLEEIRSQRQNEIEDVKSKRQAAREEQFQARCAAANARMNELDSQQAARDQQCRTAKLKRIDHFRKIESENQRLKQQATEDYQNRSAVFRSRIFP